MADNVASHLRLMLVTDDRLVQGRDLVTVALAAQRGGVTSVQLRLKLAGGRELAELARALIGALTVPVLVNDRPDVALAAGAAGGYFGAGGGAGRPGRGFGPSGVLIRAPG